MRADSQSHRLMVRIGITTLAVAVATAWPIDASSLGNGEPAPACSVPLLAGGRTVYLHCRGGIGRTGTVLGCYLVRQGQTAEEALASIDGPETVT